MKWIHYPGYWRSGGGRLTPVSQTPISARDHDAASPLSDAAGLQSRALRRRRLSDAVVDAGYDAAIIYSNGHHSLLETDGVWWSSGFKPMGESFVLLAPGDRVVLGVDRIDELARAREYVEDVVAPSDGSGEIFEALSTALRELGVDTNRVAWCGYRRLSARRHDVAGGYLSAVLVDADRILAETARLRDPSEMELARRATRIAEEAFRRLMLEIKVGDTEARIVSNLESQLRELGSEDNFVLISASGRNRAIHPPTDRTIEVGDVLLAEVSPSCEGVYTQICRTVTIGAPRGDVTIDFARLSEAFDQGLAACVPGARVSSVVDAMDRVLIGEGFGDYCRPPFMRARGHGLGIGGILPGDITSNSVEQICEGDLFVLHPNQYLPASGYLLCGEPVTIEADGAHALTSIRGELGTIEPDPC